MVHRISYFSSLGLVPCQGSELGVVRLPSRTAQRGTWHGSCSAEHHEGREAVMPLLSFGAGIASCNKSFHFAVGGIGAGFSGLESGVKDGA